MSVHPSLDLDDANDTVDALVQAEAFISGFEDDETQEGVADILAGLRAAIQREQAMPSVLAALKIIEPSLPLIADPDAIADDDCTEVTISWRDWSAIRAAIAAAEGR